MGSLSSVPFPPPPHPLLLPLPSSLPHVSLDPYTEGLVVWVTLKDYGRLRQGPVYTGTKKKFLDNRRSPNKRTGSITVGFDKIGFSIRAPVTYLVSFELEQVIPFSGTQGVHP